MRSGGGKAKGASFERDICVQLSRWMSNNEREDLYWRSALSGGRTTVGRRRGVELSASAGDISCVHATGHALTDNYYIECKHYRDLNYLGLLKGNGKLVEFWMTTKREATNSGKHPLLIAKQNLIPAMACLSIDGARLLQLEKRALLIAPKLNLRIIPLFEFFKYAERPQ
jgi:hypothetical protein